MMKLPTDFNRHVVGLTAIAVAIAVLGYAAITAMPRRVASLPEESVAIAQQAPIEATEGSGNFTSQLQNIPKNAYGSAQAPEKSLGQTITSGIKAVLPSMGSNSASRDWSEEDWQIAERAVSDHRGASANKNGARETNLANIIWQPPEEIANRQANK